MLEEVGPGVRLSQHCSVLMWRVIVTEVVDITDFHHFEKCEISKVNIRQCHHFKDNELNSECHINSQEKPLLP